MNSAAWRFGPSSACEMWGESGLAVIRTEGIVTSDTAAAVLASCQATVTDWASDGLMADYVQARLDIEPDRLMRSALEIMERGDRRLALPTALLVRADDLPMWRGYARLMAQGGVLRGVFTDHHAALAWTRRQAAIFSADRLSRSRSSAR
jgi:hypothetical protein